MLLLVSTLATDVSFINNFLFAHENMVKGATVPFSTSLLKDDAYIHFS